MGGVSLLFKLKLNEFHFCKQYCQILIMVKYFQEKFNITSHSLSSSRMVGEAFPNHRVYYVYILKINCDL